MSPVVRPTRTGRRPSGYDRDQADADRQATLEKMHTQLAERVGSLDSLQEWAFWLAFAKSFHRYSNTVLLLAQRPDATLVAGYRAWQAKGRQVRRGETAIKVYGPVTKREPKTDAAGQPVHGIDGKPVQEARIVGVKPVSVFDVLQTEGEPLPVQPPANLLIGQAPEGLWAAVQSFIETQGYTVTRGDCGDANGITIYDTREVRVRSDVDDAQGVRTLIHEAGHVLMHHPDQREAFSCRGIVEVEAESVAYLVTAAHGLDASQYTFNYVAGWAHNAATPGGPTVEDIVKATGQRVISAADRILQATQPEPTQVDDAHADLGVAVARPFSQVAVADRPAGMPAPSASGWERLDAGPLDGAARVRRAVSPETAQVHAVDR